MSFFVVYNFKLKDVTYNIYTLGEEFKYFTVNGSLKTENFDELLERVTPKLQDENVEKVSRIIKILGKINL